MPTLTQLNRRNVIATPCVSTATPGSARNGRSITPQSIHRKRELLRSQGGGCRFHSSPDCRRMVGLHDQVRDKAQRPKPTVKDNAIWLASVADSDDEPRQRRCGL